MYLLGAEKPNIPSPSMFPRALQQQRSLAFNCKLFSNCRKLTKSLNQIEIGNIRLSSKIMLQKYVILTSKKKTHREITVENMNIQNHFSGKGSIASQAKKKWRQSGNCFDLILFGNLSIYRIFNVAELSLIHI